MRKTLWAVLLPLLAAVGAVGLAEPASAAVPDRFGFVLFSGGGVSEQFPAATTVVPGPPGRWVVTFPGQGALNGVVHVTAVHNALATPPGRWCQADNWFQVGFDEVVRVSCYSPFGALDPTPGFSVLWTRSSGALVGGGVYGYIDSDPLGGIISQYNSALLGNTVFHAGPGQYSVAFTGMATTAPAEGGMQVTAVNPAVGARCKIGSFQSSPNGQFARILCFNPAGAFADTRFTVSFQHRRALYGALAPPNRFGYLWNVPPLGPPPTNFNSSLVPNTLVGGPSFWTASYPNIFASPGNVQVSGFGTSSNFCILHQPWVLGGGATVFVRIACFTNAGAPAPAPNGFFASYSSRF